MGSLAGIQAWNTQDLTCCLTELSQPVCMLLTSLLLGMQKQNATNPAVLCCRATWHPSWML